jgi:hypothetical protein
MDNKDLVRIAAPFTTGIYRLADLYGLPTDSSTTSIVPRKNCGSCSVNTLIVLDKM